ncbi:uncharacterized protein CLUP02_00767 [Colletotrichum lupini]|uniref:Uncharacterized protein n=1 Tax=Colletotrichum lupini TaxID=145971 RepID=A0A9Q8W999_9PEZI|nr:uncharacterized protein CLUP02_00767 [Colletotrichum lupini]UQC74120.1 hypothetical protein CLUP02_00767 [Colletotrichum lupini]
MADGPSGTQDGYMCLLTVRGYVYGVPTAKSRTSPCAAILPARLETHFSPDRATFLGSAPPNSTVSHTGRAQGPKGPFQVASRFLNPQLDTLGHSRWLRLWSPTRRQDAKCTGDAELQSRRLPCLARLTSLVTFTTLASPLINNQRQSSSSCRQQGTDCSVPEQSGLFQSLPHKSTIRFWPSLVIPSGRQPLGDSLSLCSLSHNVNYQDSNLILSFGSKLRRPRPTLVIDFNTQLGSSQDVSAYLLLQLMQAMAHVCALGSFPANLKHRHQDRADLTWSCYASILLRTSLNKRRYDFAACPEPKLGRAIISKERLLGFPKTLIIATNCYYPTTQAKSSHRWPPRVIPTQEPAEDGLARYQPAALLASDVNHRPFDRLPLPSTPDVAPNLAQTPPYHHLTTSPPHELTVLRTSLKSGMDCTKSLSSGGNLVSPSLETSYQPQEHQSTMGLIPPELGLDAGNNYKVPRHN